MHHALSQNARASLAHCDTQLQTHMGQMYAHHTLPECACFARALRRTAPNSQAAKL